MINYEVKKSIHSVSASKTGAESFKTDLKAIPVTKSTARRRPKPSMVQNERSKLSRTDDIPETHSAGKKKITKETWRETEES